MAKPFIRRWSWVLSDLTDDLPGLLTSTGLGALVGWLIASKTQPASSQLSVWSPWSIGFLAVTVLGGILWLIRGAQRHKKNPERIGSPEIHKEIVAVRQKLDLFIDGVTDDHQLVVASGAESPKTIGSSLTVPPGATVSSAIGAGPLTFTVPSGGVFGTSLTGNVVFTVPSGQTTPLPDGGTVSAYLSGKIDSRSEVIGSLTILADNEE